MSDAINHIFQKKITPDLLLSNIIVTRVTHSEMSSVKLKMKYPLCLLVDYSPVFLWLLIIIKHLQALILNKSSALHKMMLIGDARSARFMGVHNLGITTLKPVI